MFAIRHWLILGWMFTFPSLVTAQLRVTQPTADLGELRGGPAYQHRFEFVNGATEPVELIDVHLGCGCLQALYEKRAYKPGESGTLVLQLRTLGQPEGSRTWQAHVQYRQGETRHESILLLGATLRNEVVIEPSIIAMSIETTLQQELTIRDRRDMPFKVTAIVASSPAIRIRQQPTVNGMTRIVLEVRRAELTQTRQEALLEIDTDDPHYRHLQVPITLLQASPARVSAVPDQVEFLVGTPGSKLVRLRASGDQKVLIERIETDHPALQCTWAAGPGNDATLRITTLSAPEASASRASVRIHLAGATTPPVTISVHLRKE